MTAPYARPADRLSGAAYLAASDGTRYDPRSEVLVTIGASAAVFLAVMAFCGPGDEVIIPVPAWPACEACVRLAGVTPGVPAARTRRRLPARPVRGATRADFAHPVSYATSLDDVREGMHRLISYPQQEGARAHV